MVEGLINNHYDLSIWMVDFWGPGLRLRKLPASMIKVRAVRHGDVEQHAQRIQVEIMAITEAEYQEALLGLLPYFQGHITRMEASHLHAEWRREE